jgi:hypothetical protein
MALIDLWQSARETIKDKHIQQVISFAGNGKLTDGGITSSEFRAYLSFIPSELLAQYATECLTSSFDQSGFALQDIVNQIGRRLSFDVLDGAYRGKKGFVGFDGIWKSSFGSDIIVEVKTTDAYRIDLGVLAAYRSALIKGGQISEKESSILIVVGRQDTGDLEAQIRGSRHAWDIRLISVEALIRLMKLKETVEDLSVMRKIGTILTPQEFTKVDGIIDLVFSTAEDVSQGSSDVVIETNGKVTTIDQLNLEIDGNGTEVGSEVSIGATIPDKQQQALFHEQCITKVGSQLQTNLVRVSRSVYKSPDAKIAVSCAISRKYVRQKRSWYWFAFHPYQEEQLQLVPHAYAAFGCGTEKAVFLFPLEQLQSWLSGLNQTENEKRRYWHVHITQNQGCWILQRRAGFENVDITDYLIK